MNGSSHPVPIVEIDGLRKTFRPPFWRRRGSIVALSGVTMSAGPGEVFGLLGPNGAGKTTVIKSMLGIISPTSGTARLFGKPAGDRSAAVRVGYMPESLRIDPHHTGRTALAYYGKLSRMDPRQIRRRSDELLELVGLSGRDNESVRRFSKGMYQRLGLAQALLHDPDLLILDEPTDGLDPVGRNDVRSIIERLQQAGKTVFVNSHILQEVELMCSRVAILAAGQLRAIGSIDEIQTALLGAEGETGLRTECVISNSGSTESFSVAEVRRIVCQQFPEGGNDDQEFQIEPFTEDRIRICRVSEDQSQIDHLVDCLRQSGASICSLTTHRPTLEQAFIQLVGEDGRREL